MAWKITEDHLQRGEDSAVGTVSLGPELTGDTYAFRLLDDDDNVYYDGLADDSAASKDENPGGLYDAERWGAVHAGAIHLELRCRDAVRLNLWTQDLADKLGQSPSTWVRPFN
jgi:hypothetical protein